MQSPSPVDGSKLGRNRKLTRLFWGPEKNRSPFFWTRNPKWGGPSLEVKQADQVEKIEFSWNFVRDKSLLKWWSFPKNYDYLMVDLDP